MQGKAVVLNDRESGLVTDFRGLMTEATRALHRAMRKTQIVRMEAEHGTLEPGQVDGIARSLRDALYSFECVESKGVEMARGERSAKAPESGTLTVAKDIANPVGATDAAADEDACAHGLEPSEVLALIHDIADDADQLDVHLLAIESGIGEAAHMRRARDLVGCLRDVVADLKTRSGYARRGKA